MNGHVLCYGQNSTPKRYPFLSRCWRVVSACAVQDNACMADFTDLKRDALARHLRKHLRGEVRFDPASRRLYSTEASIYQIEPLGVVIPRTVADIVATVQIAGEMQTPITARGGGRVL